MVSIRVASRPQPTPDPSGAATEGPGNRNRTRHGPGELLPPEALGMSGVEMLQRFTRSGGGAGALAPIQPQRASKDVVVGLAPSAAVPNREVGFHRSIHTSA